MSESMRLGRRAFLRSSAAVAAGPGLYSSLALAAERDGGGLLAPLSTHHQPKAKNLLIIFLTGGFSHVDTFDYKPALAARHHGKSVPSFGLRPDETHEPPAHGLAVPIPGLRRVGADDQRAVLEPRDDGRRTVRDPFAAHGHRRAFPGGAGDAHRLGDGPDAEPRCLAQLWIGDIEPESARLRGHSANTCRTPAARSGTAASSRPSTRA